MEDKKVIITLGKDGSIKVEAHNFKGASCQEATKFLNDLFGSPNSVGLKESFFETDEVNIADGLPSGYCG